MQTKKKCTGKSQLLTVIIIVCSAVSFIRAGVSPVNYHKVLNDPAASITRLTPERATNSLLFSPDSILCKNGEGNGKGSGSSRYKLPGGNAENPVIENNAIYVKFRSDLNGFTAIIDKKTGRNYASGLDTTLYRLRFANNYKDTSLITSNMASRHSFTRVKNGLELQYWHEGKIPFIVVCKITFGNDSSLLKWTIKVQNKSQKTLSTIEYPIIACTPVLGVDSADDGLVYPLYEGSLLTGLSKKGIGVYETYPGNLSAQLMYFFDPAGGLYYAAYDGKGYRKSLGVINTGQGLILLHKYFLPIAYKKEIELPYEIVTGFSAGNWESGAERYRQWAQKQTWCTQTLSQRDIPGWLKAPNLFMFFNYKSPDYESVEKADISVRKYHDFYGLPVIACGWSWEKNGAWMGPDFFPPVHGEQYYSDLAKKGKERGDHFQLLTSGFRWAVKKPLTQKTGETRFTDYDGTDLFMKNGAKFTVMDQKGALFMEKRPWAYNYFLCPGSKSARNIIDSCFNHIYKWGISGVSLDQQLGGHVDDCFSQDHGHPVGAGLWQYQAMRNFLRDARSNAKSISADNFVTLEEAPSELFIPMLDFYYGRAYTLSQWPVSGPGAVSIPLHIFLYHQYQLAFSCQINEKSRAPFGNPKNAIGRNFIFGMGPGIGFQVEKGLLKGDVTDDMKMIRGSIELIKKYPDCLVLGKMKGEIQVKGDRPVDTLDQKGEPAYARNLWHSVQGFSWLSDAGNKIIYTLANLSDKTQEIQIKLLSESKEPLEFTGYVLDQEIKQNIAADKNGSLALTLAPWQLSVIKQVLKPNK